MRMRRTRTTPPISPLNSTSFAGVPSRCCSAPSALLTAKTTLISKSQIDVESQKLPPPPRPRQDHCLASWQTAARTHCTASLAPLALAATLVSHSFHTIHSFGFQRVVLVSTTERLLCRCVVCFCNINGEKGHKLYRSSCEECEGNCCYSLQSLGCPRL